MAYRWLGVVLLSTVFAVGCADAGSGDPRVEGGTGGAAGSGGNGGNGGTAGVGGSQVSCVTSALCRSCPSDASCEVNQDCAIGSVCVESGCDSVAGLPMKQCVFVGGGACNTSSDCPAGRDCLEVPVEGKRCIKTTPGCDTSFDCVTGFSCENGNCVDRRLPCNFDSDCPKNHICVGTTGSAMCLRIHRDCASEFDCLDLAPLCEDIDGDGNTECAGAFDLNQFPPDACVNSQCADPSAPVCESAGAGSTTQCGQYGLCLGDSDCAAGFSCVALWPDGRKECVPNGGSCSKIDDCPIQQVCASPRNGGPPSCQAGYQR